MKVSELIAELERIDPEKEVGFSFDSGDYWRNVLVKPIREVNILYVTHSDYHESLRITGDDEGDNVADDAVEMIILEG